MPTISIENELSYKFLLRRSFSWQQIGGSPLVLSNCAPTQPDHPHALQDVGSDGMHLHLRVQKWKKSIGNGFKRPRSI